MPKVSIIIPTYQHASVLGNAILFCTHQTHADIEVIVVDDASTDSTWEGARYYWADDSRVKFTRLVQHAGPSFSRNYGLAEATGDFVMFLDADDTIDAPKVEKQLRELARFPDADWCLCDVRIKESNGSIVLASERYRYKDKDLSGWMYPLLRDGNFIPIMAPLVRRQMLIDNDIRFDDRLVPEDYHFWCKVAKVARVRYIPDVLATYNKSKNGRNSTSAPAWKRFNPTFTPPLRLNLGCGTQGTRSWHPMQGFINLDKSMGWKFQDGLGDFVDGSVSGITISHALMYVQESDWPFIFREFLRVLAPGGVLRITEDEAIRPESSRCGGWKGSDPAIAIIGDDMLDEALFTAGFQSKIVGPTETQYVDSSLIQQVHGDPPDVFFVEGVKRA